MVTTTSTTTTRTTTAPAPTKTTTTIPAPKTPMITPAPAAKVQPMYFNEATKSWAYGTPPPTPAPVVKAPDAAGKAISGGVAKIVQTVTSGAASIGKAITEGAAKAGEIIKTDVSQTGKAVGAGASSVGKFVSDVAAGAKISASGTAPMYFDTVTSSWKYGTAPPTPPAPTPPKITVTGGGAITGGPVSPISLVSGLPTGPKPAQTTPVVAPPKVEIKKDEVGKSVTTITKEQMTTTSPFGTKVTEPTRPMFFDPYEQRWRYGTIEKTDTTTTVLDKGSMSTTAKGGTTVAEPGSGKFYDIDASEKAVLEGNKDLISKGLMTVTRTGDTLTVTQPSYKIMINEGYDINAMEQMYKNAPEVSLGLLKVSRSGDTLTLEKPIFATTVQAYGTEAQKQLERKMETIWKQATPLEKIGLGAQFIMAHGIGPKGAEFVLSPESRAGYMTTQLTGAATDKGWFGKEMFSAATEGVPSLPISYALGYGTMSALKIPAVAGVLGGVSKTGVGLITKVPVAGPAISSALTFAAAHPRAVGAALVGGFESLKAAEMATGKYLTLGGIQTGEVKSPAYILGSVGGDIARIAAFGGGMKARMLEDLPKVDVKSAKIQVHKDMKVGEMGDATVKSNLVDPKTGKVAGKANFDGQIQKLPDDPAHPDENFYRIDGDVSYKVKGGATVTKEVTGPGMIKKLYPKGVEGMPAGEPTGVPGETTIVTEHVDTTFHISKVKLYDAANKFKLDFINDIMNPDKTQLVLDYSRTLGKATEAEAVSKKIGSVTFKEPKEMQFRAGEPDIKVSKIDIYKDIGGERAVGGKEITPSLGTTSVYISPRTPDDSLSKLMQGLEPPKETEAEALQRIKSSLDIKPSFKPFDFIETAPTGTPSGAGAGTSVAGGAAKAGAGAGVGPSALSQDLADLGTALKSSFAKIITKDIAGTITTPIMPIVSAATFTGAEVKATTKYTPVSLVGQLTFSEEGYKPVSITGETLIEKPEPPKPVVIPSGTIQATMQEVTTITTPILEPPTTVQQEIQKVETGFGPITYTTPFVETPPPFFPFITGFGGGGGGGGGVAPEKEEKKTYMPPGRIGWSVLDPDLFSEAVSQAAFGKATRPKFTRKQTARMRAESLIRVPTAEFISHPEEMQAGEVLKRLIGRR